MNSLAFLPPWRPQGNRVRNFPVKDPPTVGPLSFLYHKEEKGPIRCLLSSPDRQAGAAGLGTERHMEQAGSVCREEVWAWKLLGKPMQFKGLL